MAELERIYKDTDTGGWGWVTQEATGGGGVVPDSIISTFSANDLVLTPFMAAVTFPGGGNTAWEEGSNLSLVAAGIEILADGTYVIEIDNTVYLGATAGVIGTVIQKPLFLIGDNWIAASEGGTWWTYVDQTIYTLGNPEFTRTYPPVVLQAGERIGVEASFTPGQGSSTDDPQYGCLLTVVQVA